MAVVANNQLKALTCREAPYLSYQTPVACCTRTTAKSLFESSCLPKKKLERSEYCHEAFERAIYRGYESYRTQIGVGEDKNMPYWFHASLDYPGPNRSEAVLLGIDQRQYSYDSVRNEDQISVGRLPSFDGIDA